MSESVKPDGIKLPSTDQNKYWEGSNFYELRYARDARESAQAQHLALTADLRQEIERLNKQNEFLQTIHDAACIGLTKAVEARREAEELMLTKEQYQLVESSIGSLNANTGDGSFEPDEISFLAKLKAQSLEGSK